MAFALFMLFDYIATRKAEEAGELLPGKQDADGEAIREP